MTLNEFKNIITAICPNAIIQEDEYGEILIDTGMTADESANLVPGDSAILREIPDQPWGKVVQCWDAEGNSHFVVEEMEEDCECCRDDSFN